MSVWEEIADCSVVEGEQRGADSVRVGWQADGNEAEARVEYIDERPRLVSFTVANLGGGAVHGKWRRVPSDAFLLRILLGLEDGVYALTWLRQRFESESGSHRSLEDEILLTKETRATRPSRSTDEQQDKEVAWMLQQLDKGLTASVVTSTFQDKFFRSPATAYRRLKKAREEKESNREGATNND